MFAAVMNRELGYHFAQLAPGCKIHVDRRRAAILKMKEPECPDIDLESW